MIKKISQLDELEQYHSTIDPAALNHNDLLFEVSYKGNNSDETDTGYYTSYHTDLSTVKYLLGIDDLKELVDVIANGGLSTITYDGFTFGELGGTPKNDRVRDETYSPDQMSLSSYAKFYQDNDLIVKGETNFRNNVTISCDDADVESADKPSLCVDGVARFNKVIHGTAFRAQWGDLAEIYDADEAYAAGTLVKFGGEREITIATDKANAVVSLEPGLILDGASADHMKNPTKIALVGKVPIRVRGPVKKFDTIVLSKTEPGVGVVYNYALPYEIVGKALEDNSDANEKLVLCATNLTLR